jgi:glucokinase
MIKETIAIGIDIGGSHISCGAVDLCSNRLISGSVFESAVDNTASAETILDTWTNTLRRTINLIGRNRLSGIGFAMPGPFDYANGIARFERVEKYLSLNGVHVDNEIRSRLELPAYLPVRFMNDATAFAVAEAWIGIGKCEKKIIALTLGTGFGSAFVDRGIPILQGDTVPEMGCVWHLPYKEGIADEYFSTRWFERSYLEKTGTNVNGVKELFERSATDEAAMQLFRVYGSQMGDFIGPWVSRFGAGKIVIGGNITGAYSAFGPELTASLTRQGITAGVGLSELKENAAIIGSARLTDDDFFTKMEPLLSLM